MVEAAGVFGVELAVGVIEGVNVNEGVREGITLVCCGEPDIVLLGIGVSLGVGEYNE